jgi:hypothetical protein
MRNNLGGFFIRNPSFVWSPEFPSQCIQHYPL